MNKKLKFKVTALGVGIIAIVLAMGLFTVAKADSSLIDRIAQYVGQVVGNNINQKIESSGALDSLNVSDGELALGGLTANTNYEVNNGDVTYHLSGSFINGSTTFVSFYSPFLAATSSASDVVVEGTYPNGHTVASSTVDLLRLNITGVATSTFTVACGASATNGANGAGTQAYAIISSGDVATSTKALIENNLTNSYGSQVTAGTVAKIALGPTYPYLVCKVTSVYTGAFTEVTNTFDGKFVARVSKTQY